MATTTLAVHRGDELPDIDEFYRTHRADAVRWATALVGRPEIGEELAQEALIAVGRKLASVDDPAAYLRRSVVNRAASWHRWHHGEQRRLLRAGSGAAISYTDETSEMLGALTVLPYKQRAAVTLRFWAGWADADIADALGCQPPTVRVLVHRAIATLRTELER